MNDEMLGPSPGRAPAVALPRWRRTLGVIAALTGIAATAGTVQLVTGTFTPPVGDLEPLGLHSWVLPGLWLAASVAVPCAVTTMLAWKRSRWLGLSALASGALLLIELAVQIPFIGLDPLQGLMALIAITLMALGVASHRGQRATAHSLLPPLPAVRPAERRRPDS
jgi:hypothetical protein